MDEVAGEWSGSTPKGKYFPDASKGKNDARHKRKPVASSRIAKFPLSELYV